MSWVSGAEGWRWKIILGSSGGSWEARTTGVSPLSATFTKLVSTPKLCNLLTTNSPSGSTPTLVTTALLWPSLAAATATFVGDPPIDF